MAAIELQIPPSTQLPDDPKFPNGHAASFRKGVVVGLEQQADVAVSNGHELSYHRGKLMGAELRAKIFELERD